MSWLRQFLFRFLALFRRRKLEEEMAKEMQAHLEMRARRNVDAGFAPDEARYAAQREFGGIEQVKEAAREQRSWIWAEQLVQDLRYAVRSLCKSPNFTITAVLTLAFGIGVNAGLFTLYNAVALRALPAYEPEQLVTFRLRSGGGRGFSYLDYLDYRNGNHTLSGLAAIWEGMVKLDDRAGAEPDRFFNLAGWEYAGSSGMVGVQFVSENYFDVLGMRPSLGRGFLPEENSAPGTGVVIVLSHLFWERHLHSDPDVLGKSVVLDAQPFTVVGVASPEFVGHQPAPPAGWVPATMMKWPRALTAREITPFTLIGRLKPNVTEQQARADLDVIAARLPPPKATDRRSRSIQLERGLKFLAITMNDRVIAIFTPIVMGFVLVFVISCTNVANLLLARGVARQQEISTRLSLGASRSRIIRQLFTENGLLCLLGALAGLVLSKWTVALVFSQVPAEWGHAGEIRHWQFLYLGVDFRVAAVTAVLALAAAVAAGLVPAIFASRANLISALKNEGTFLGRRFTPSRLRNVLVVVQVAVCLILLSCAGLLVRNLVGLRRLDLGYDPSVIYRFFAGPKTPLPDSQAQAAAVRRATEVVRALPGVVSACWAVGGPIGGTKGSMITPVTVMDAKGANIHQGLRYALVSSGFFDTFGIPLRRGRAFSASEVEAGARVIIVSEATARRLWPGEDALGRTVAVSEPAFSWPPTPRRGSRDCEVVGIARDIRNEITDPEPLALYLPLSPEVGTPGAFVIRPSGESSSARTEIARLAESAGMALQFGERFSTRLEEVYQPFIVLAWLSGSLGALALLMASVGLYGVMAFSVGQRVREIGIRVALGATASRVITLFVRQGMKLVIVGMVIGLVGGALFAQLLTKIMFGLGGAFDPVAFFTVTLILAIVAFVACWLPARRAARVDPMIALRCE